MQADGFSQFDCCQRSGEGRKRKGLKILLRHSALNIPPPPPLPLIPVKAPSHLPHPLISSALFGFRLFWAKSFTSRFTQTLHLINFPSFSSPSTSSLLFLLSGSGLILSAWAITVRKLHNAGKEWQRGLNDVAMRKKRNSRVNRSKGQTQLSLPAFYSPIQREVELQETLLENSHWFQLLNIEAFTRFLVINADKLNMFLVLDR